MQRQAKQARETCFSMLITTVCLFLKAYCILTLTLILIAGIRYRFRAILHTLSFTTGSSYKQGLLCLKDSRNKRKTERSGVLMLITTVCLFSICITLTLIFYHWHTLSLIAVLYTAISLSFTDYLASYFHKILYTAISLHSLHYYARKRPILGLVRKGLPWNPVQKNWVLG